MKQISYVIGRYVGTTTLNGKEYVLDDDGNVMKFTTEELAIKFLTEAGFPELTDDSNIFIDEKENL